VGGLDLHWHNLGVGLGGGQVFVTQQLLDVADIGALLQEMGGAGAPEGVGRDRLGDDGETGLGANIMS
jgi:hypothetical protein